MLLCVNPLRAQAPEAVSILQIGGPGDDAVTDIAAAPDAAIAACGVFAESAAFDPSNVAPPLDPLGRSDGFVALYAPEGTLRWVRQLGGRAADRANAVAVDESGSVYVAGAFALRMEVEIGGERVVKAAVGRRDAFIAKLTPDGAFQWFITLGGEDEDEALDVAPDGAGGCFVVGYVTGAADLDTRPGSMSVDPRGGRDGFLLHLKVDGQFTWGGFIGGSGNDEAVAVATTDDGGAVASGGFSSTITIDRQQAKCAGKQDAFIARFDSDGSAQWLRSIGGPGVDRAAPGGMTIDAVGRIAVTGQFENRARFGESILASAGGTDGFVAVLDRQGNAVKSFSIGGGRNDTGQAIAFDAAGGLVVAGMFAGTADFNPTDEELELRATSRRPMAFLALYDSSLVIQRVASLGDTGTEPSDAKQPAVRIASIATNPAGIAFAGPFSGIVGFSLDGAAAGNHAATAQAADGFIWKIPTLQP